MPASLLAIPFLPLASFVLTLLFGRRMGVRAHWLPIVTVLASFVCALLAFFRVQHGEIINQDLYTWIESGTLRISASSGQAVTSISILVSIQGENPATIATVVPTITPQPQPTITPVPTPVIQADVPAEPVPTGPRTVQRVDLATLGVALTTMLVMISLMLVVLLRIMPRQMLMYRMLWATIAGPDHGWTSRPILVGYAIGIVLTASFIL